MDINPFSTRFIRPGAVPFLFQDGQTAASLVDKLAAHNWWGQIIGPHGSGKSTLLATLVPALESAGRCVVRIALRQGERRLAALIDQEISPITQLVIDGYEQLSWWSRWRLKSICRRQNSGLLITAHQGAGLPTIYRTESTEQVTQAIVAQLLGDRLAECQAPEIAAAYRAAGGNIRETLFKLYDVHAERGASCTARAE